MTATNQLPLFETSKPNYRPPLARFSDPEESHRAADKIRPHLSKLQSVVHGAFRELGKMTAKECEVLDRFSELGFSTVRKRISELKKMGLIVDTGERREGAAVWECKP